MIFDGFGEAKSVFFIGRGDKIGPKMSLGSSGSDFDLILAAFGVPGGA